jgi:hypothetical protein
LSVSISEKIQGNKGETLFSGKTERKSTKKEVMRKIKSTEK